MVLRTGGKPYLMLQAAPKTSRLAATHLIHETSGHCSRRLVRVATSILVCNGASFELEGCIGMMRTGISESMMIGWWEELEEGRDSLPVTTTVDEVKVTTYVRKVRPYQTICVESGQTLI